MSLLCRCRVLEIIKLFLSQIVQVPFYIRVSYGKDRQYAWDEVCTSESEIVLSHSDL